MKSYNPNTGNSYIHTIDVTLQIGEFSGVFRVEVGGNILGGYLFDELLDDICLYSFTGINGSEISGDFNEDETLDITLINSKNERQVFEIDQDNILSYITKLEIVDYTEDDLL